MLKEKMNAQHSSIKQIVADQMLKLQISNENAQTDQNMNTHRYEKLK